MSTERIRRFLISAVTASIAASAVAFGAPPTAAAQDCPDIEVIFARGTDDTPGLGTIGGAFVSALKNKVGGRSVGAYAVNYPASYNFLLAGDGANDASAHVQFMMGACPNTKLVLGGYSQGAAVIDVITSVPVPILGFNNPLPPNAPDFVAAVVAFGNPSAKLGAPLTIAPVWGSRAIDLCNAGDPICQTDGENLNAHKTPNYTGNFVNQAANFAAGRL